MSLYKHNTPEYKHVRQKLRKNQTKAEKLLWQRLRENPFHVRFRRQFGIGDYIVDFYCHTYKIIIEVDGYTHGDKSVQKKDIIKENYLKEQGYQVLRYTDDQVLENTDSVLIDICKYML